MLSILRICTILFLAAFAAAAPFIRAASSGPKFVVYHDLWMEGKFCLFDFDPLFGSLI
jgi:hypothetical protein